MNEFRQFRISQRSYDDSIEMIVGNADDLADDLHVIEYKAYSKLKEENELLRAAFKREITKLSDINASDFDKYEREITDLKHDHKIMLDALESLSTGLAFAQGFISVHSTEAELFVTKQYENYKEAISQLKHKENI